MAATDDYEETDGDREFLYRHTDARFFLEALESDVHRCEALCAAMPDDRFARRTLVRTVWAEIEGLCASAIDWARYYASDASTLKGRYTEAERIALRGVVAHVENGAARLVESGYLRTKEMLKFALTLVGRGAATLLAVDYGDGGWSALIESLVVRHRLMHPKCADDLLVTDEEMQKLERGRSWFITTYKARDRAEQATIAAEITEGFRQWMRENRVGPASSGQDDG
jgi:hypothetical protein